VDQIPTPKWRIASQRMGVLNCHLNKYSTKRFMSCFFVNKSTVNL
jgi:hypothetical protein